MDNFWSPVGLVLVIFVLCGVLPGFVVYVRAQKRDALRFQVNHEEDISPAETKWAKSLLAEIREVINERKLSLLGVSLEDYPKTECVITIGLLSSDHPKESPPLLLIQIHVSHKSEQDYFPVRVWYNFDYRREDYFDCVDPQIAKALATNLVQSAEEIEHQILYAT